MSTIDWNIAFSGWADLLRNSLASDPTVGSWNSLIDDLSPTGQRRLRFVESSIYTSTRADLPKSVRKRIAKYMLTIGLVIDIQYKRPEWIQPYLERGLQGQVFGINQRAAVYHGVASSLHSQWVPGNAVRPHSRLTQALRDLAAIDQRTVSELRQHGTLEHYSTGGQETNNASHTLAEAITDILLDLREYFDENMHDILGRVFISKLI